MSSFMDTKDRAPRIASNGSDDCKIVRIQSLQSLQSRIVEIADATRYGPSPIIARGPEIVRVL